MRHCSLIALVLTALLLPLDAFAHAGHSAGCAHGFAHPFSGIDHLLAMLAVGWWSASALAQRWWLVPLAFAAATLMGALAGVAAPIADAGIEVAIAVSLLLLGVLLAARIRLQPGLALPLCVFLGALHGLAHGQELPGTSAAGAWLAGMVIATLALHLAGAIVGSATPHRHRWLPRVGGAAVAGTGIALLFSLVLS